MPETVGQIQSYANRAVCNTQQGEEKREQGAKSKSPKTKIQIPKKSQNPNSKGPMQGRFVWSVGEFDQGLPRKGLLTPTLSSSEEEREPTRGHPLLYCGSPEETNRTNRIDRTNGDGKSLIRGGRSRMVWFFGHAY